MQKPQHITGTFRLHNVSAWRRNLLDNALYDYSREMVNLLDWSEQNLDMLREKGNKWTIKATGDVKEGSYKAMTLATLLPRPDVIPSLRDALMQNVGKMLASFLELEKGDKQEAGFPISRDPSPEGYKNALRDFVELYLLNDLDTTKERAEQQENIARARLQTLIKSNRMPVEFCRYRDCRYLMDLKTKNLYVWLMVADSSNRQSQIKDLVDINTGEQFKMKSKVGILIPVEYNEWQYDKFIKGTIAGHCTPKVSKLIILDGEYYLHTSFAFDCAEPYEPESYLGIDRGVFFSMAYAVVDTKGKIILMDHKEDGFRHDRIQAGKAVQRKQRKGRPANVKDYRGKRQEQILHILINDIIDVALKHRSMIVLEDLNIRIRGKFYKSAWKKLHWMLEYKCKLAGVPFRKAGVWAAYTSQICIFCGYLNKERKRDGSPFICPNPKCKAVYHSDDGAGVNIARRVLYKKKDWGGTKKKAGDYFAFHRSFANT